jgi:hypothetical protein
MTTTITIRSFIAGLLLATSVVAAPATAMAANSPSKVEMYEKGQLKLVLGKSDAGSLNGRKGVAGTKYDGRADKVRIQGKAGSIVAFFDDQKFRTGENFVIIRKTTANPITIQIGKNFVEDAKEAGNGIYKGTGPGYEWILMKSVKKDFFSRYKINELLSSGFVPHGDKLLKGLELAGAGETTSSNYRVDNCSSVRFGD